MRGLPFWLAPAFVLAFTSSCELLRPSVISQLNPDVVRLVNELPAVDHPNEAVVARLFAHGGLNHAKRGRDGVYRDHSVNGKQYLAVPTGWGGWVEGYAPEM